MDKTITENGRTFLHYRLEAEALCLGERIRGSVFRPCLQVFTYTGLVGAFKARFPHPTRKIHAAGRFLAKERHLLIFSPRDRCRETSIVPLEIEYLSGVQAELFVEKNDFTVTWPERFTLRPGAMKSKGFGDCRIAKVAERRPNQKQTGKLAMRVPENSGVQQALGIDRVETPVYGYLFHPERGGTGHYERALFEGSVVEADPMLLMEESDA